MFTPTTKCSVPQENSPFALFCINSLSPINHSQQDYWQSLLRAPNLLRNPRPRRYCNCKANRKDCSNCLRVACVSQQSTENKVVLTVVGGPQKALRTSIGDTPQPRKQTRPTD